MRGDNFGSFQTWVCFSFSHTCYVCDNSFAETSMLEKQQVIHALALYVQGEVRFHLAIWYDNGSICPENAFKFAL